MELIVHECQFNSGIRQLKKNCAIRRKGIEHHVHQFAIVRIMNFVEFAQQDASWFETFEETLA